MELDNTGKATPRHRLLRSGFTRELVAWCRAFQGGRCALCDRLLVLGGRSNASECADHTEVDGRKVPRGLLCRRCNIELGFYEKTLHRHARFALYVAQPPTTQKAPAPKDESL